MHIDERVVFRHTHTHTHRAIYSIRSFTEKFFINFRVSLIQQKDIFNYHNCLLIEQNCTGCMFWPYVLSHCQA